MSTHASKRCKDCGTINKDPFDTYCPDCAEARDEIQADIDEEERREIMADEELD